MASGAEHSRAEAVNTRMPATMRQRSWIIGRYRCQGRAWRPAQLLPCPLCLVCDRSRAAVRYIVMCLNGPSAPQQTPCLLGGLPQLCGCCFLHLDCLMGARVTRTRPGFDAVECVRPIMRLTRLNALRMREHVVRVEGGLDLFEPLEVRSPVRVLPVCQVEIALVHVGGPRHIRSHRRVQRAHVAEALGRIARDCPRAAVLDAIERAAVCERGRVWGDARDRAAV